MSSVGTVLRVALTPLFSRRTWREFAYVLLGLVMAVPTFVLALLGLVFSALSLVAVGLPFLIAVLWLARGTVRWFRAPARALLGWDWASPQRRSVGRLLRDRTAWKALAYCFLTFPIKLTAVYAGAIALISAPLAVANLLWSFDEYPWGSGGWLVAQSVAALLIFPWLIRLLVALDRLLAYALLAPNRDQVRIVELVASRAALQADAIAQLRRVERDLHDGTQARLVALGVTLSRIERRAAEPEVKTMAKDARGTVTDALAELRDIVRGLHPPALDDGLEVALQSLAGRSAVPVEVRVRLPAKLPDATASAIYFTVAELLTNVARHAGATSAWVDLRGDGRRLRLAVSDDGHGGADPDSSGTGLRGLARRAAALDGTLTVDSPAGGPTIVTVELPVGGPA
jgi:signal transduction histidine kinase